MEQGNNFKSYSELCGFIDELYKSVYYKMWVKMIKQQDNKKTGEG